MKKIANSSKLLKRVSRVSTAPKAAQIAPILKRKGKPRGKSFEVGNRFGLATRFKPGNVANPEGRPSLKKMNAACIDALAQIVPKEELRASNLPIGLYGLTYAEIATFILKMEGLRGNLQAIEQLVERAEGKAATSVFVDGDKNPIAILIASMNDRSDETGPPEGWQPKRLKGGDDGRKEIGTVAGTQERPEEAD